MTINNGARRKSPIKSATTPSKPKIKGPATFNSFDPWGVSLVGEVACPMPPAFEGELLLRLEAFASPENPIGPERRRFCLLGESTEIPYTNGIELVKVTCVHLIASSKRPSVAIDTALRWRVQKGLLGHRCSYLDEENQCVLNVALPD